MVALRPWACRPAWRIPRIPAPARKTSPIWRMSWRDMRLGRRTGWPMAKCGGGRWMKAAWHEKNIRRNQVKHGQTGGIKRKRDLSEKCVWREGERGHNFYLMPSSTDTASDEAMRRCKTSGRWFRTSLVMAGESCGFQRSMVTSSMWRTLCTGPMECMDRTAWLRHSWKLVAVGSCCRSLMSLISGGPHTWGDMACSIACHIAPLIICIWIFRDWSRGCHNDPKWASNKNPGPQ